MAKTPKPGDTVSWGTPQGKTHGTVRKIVTAPTQVRSHMAKASKEAPQVLVTSDTSGKGAVHKPGKLKPVRKGS